MNSEMIVETVTITRTIRVEGVPAYLPSPAWGGPVQPIEAVLAWVDGQPDRPAVVRAHREDGDPNLLYDITYWPGDDWPAWLVSLVDEYAPKDQP